MKIRYYNTIVFKFLRLILSTFGKHESEHHTLGRKGKFFSSAASKRRETQTSLAQMDQRNLHDGACSKLSRLCKIDTLND